jgi:phage terminase large subunit GpA-like protein
MFRVNQSFFGKNTRHKAENQDDRRGNYCHFPIGRPLDYFRMMTAESLVRRYRAGRAVLEWQNTRRERNESLDCRVYAIASLHSLLMAGLNLDQHSEQFAAMLKPAPVQQADGAGSRATRA